MAGTADTTIVTRFRVCGALHLGSVFAPLRQGTGDPSLRLLHGEVWRAMRTPDGAATLHLRLAGDRLEADAVGPGSERAIALAPGLAGLLDDPSQLRPQHPAVAEARRRRPGLRLSRGTPVSEALVWAVLAQKVVGVDARRSHRDLVRRLGEPAPGTTGLLVPPSAATLAATPSWVYHRCNVEWRRAGTIVALARRAGRLDALSALPAEAARATLRTLPGVGEWSAAVVTAASHGDPDAVPLGDFHIPNAVSYALAGEPRGDDARMLELLEPYRGQRGRVIRLLMAGGRGAPRYGPPMGLHDIRAL